MGAQAHARRSHLAHSLNQEAQQLVQRYQSRAAFACASPAFLTSPTTERLSPHLWLACSYSHLAARGPAHRTRPSTKSLRNMSTCAINYSPHGNRCSTSTAASSTSTLTSCPAATQIALPSVPKNLPRSMTAGSNITPKQNSWTTSTPSTTGAKWRGIRWGKHKQPLRTQWPTEVVPTG